MLKEAVAKFAKPRVVGNAKIMPITALKPNTWNPNRMTEFERESLSYGLKTDGWIASQALLVWGKDNRGKRRDLIIDGEQRWTVAIPLGFKEAPVVVLDGLTETQAKRLTIKLDQKRGHFDRSAVASVIQSIIDTGEPDVGIDLGFTDAEIAALMKPVLPPEDFRTVDVDVTTEYCCPKCGYEWSGAANGSKGAKSKTA